MNTWPPSLQQQNPTPPGFPAPLQLPLTFRIFDVDSPCLDFAGNDRLNAHFEIDEPPLLVPALGSAPSSTESRNSDLPTPRTDLSAPRQLHFSSSPILHLPAPPQDQFNLRIEEDRAIKHVEDLPSCFNALRLDLTGIGPPCSQGLGPWSGTSTQLSQLERTPITPSAATSPTPPSHGALVLSPNGTALTDGTKIITFLVQGEPAMTLVEAMKDSTFLDNASQIVDCFRGSRRITLHIKWPGEARPASCGYVPVKKGDIPMTQAEIAQRVATSAIKFMKTRRRCQHDRILTAPEDVFLESMTYASANTWDFNPKIRGADV